MKLSTPNSVFKKARQNGECLFYKQAREGNHGGTNPFTSKAASQDCSEWRADYRGAQDGNRS